MKWLWAKLSWAVLRSWKGGEIPTLTFPSVFQKSWLPRILRRKYPALRASAQGRLYQPGTQVTEGKPLHLLELQFLVCEIKILLWASQWEAGKSRRPPAGKLQNWSQCPQSRSSPCPSLWTPGPSPTDSTIRTPNSPPSSRLLASHWASVWHATQLPAWFQASFALPGTRERLRAKLSFPGTRFLITVLPSEKAALWHQGCAEAWGLKSTLQTSVLTLRAGLMSGYSWHLSSSLPNTVILQH